MPDDTHRSPLPGWVFPIALVVDLGILFAGLLTGNIALTAVGALALAGGIFVVLVVLPRQRGRGPTAPRE